MRLDRDQRSDAELIAAAAEDPDAFRCLYDRHAARIHRFFVRRCGDRDAAVDLTAETFAQAWVSKHRFSDLAGGTAGPWLFIIARRVLLGSVRRQKVEMKMLERLQVDLEPHNAAAPDECWLVGLDAEISAALDGLPRNHRRALELRVFAGLPYATIAAELGCSSTAARIRVSRSLNWLRTQMEGS